MKQYNNEIKLYIHSMKVMLTIESLMYGLGPARKKMWLNHPDELISDRIGICVREFHAIA